MRWLVMAVAFGASFAPLALAVTMSKTDVSTPPTPSPSIGVSGKGSPPARDPQGDDPPAVDSGAGAEDPPAAVHAGATQTSHPVVRTPPPASKPVATGGDQAKEAADASASAAPAKSPKASTPGLGVFGALGAVAVLVALRRRA